MALFTRRVLQRCLDEANSYASRRKIREWVKKLNSSSERNYVATEWEVVLLHSLSKVGSLIHPEETPEHATLDVVFTSSDHNLSFSADIVTISDRGIHENNPIEQLQQELDKRFRTLSFKHGGFDLRVEHLSRQRKGIKSVLPLPKRQDFNRLIFNKDFEHFVERIRNEPDVRHVYQIRHDDPQTAASIFYDPRLNGAGHVSYGSYVMTTVIDSNPLYNTLRNKAEHLRRAAYAGHQGIIVCDGGANVLTERSDWNSFSNADVVHHFLNGHRSVDFVLTLGLKDNHSGTLRQKVVPELLVLREEPWHHNLNQVFTRAIATLPHFVQSPENAYRDLEFWNNKEEKRFHLGGMSMSGGRDGITEIRMSTRTLLDLLAGRLSQERFNKNYSHANGVSLFEFILRSGRLLTSASVKRLPDQDDDELILTFGEHDSAAGKFVRPPTSLAEGPTALPKAGVKPEGRND